MSNQVSRAAGILVFVIGLISSVLSILVAPPELQIASVAFLVLASFGIGGWLILRPLLNKRRADAGLKGVDELEKPASYVVVQAEPEDIEWIAELEKEIYSEEDAIPGHVLKEWYHANPSGFFVIKTKYNVRVGHLDILPLKPRTLREFVEGKIVEKDIRGDSLYGVDEKDKITDLYVESIIIRPTQGISSANAIRCLLANLGFMVRCVANVEKVERVYAIAASTAGERLMRHLGFEICGKPEARRDKHPLFVADTVTVAENIAKICDDRISEADRPVLTKLLRRAAESGI